MFGQDRRALRQVFLDAWRKYRERSALEPLEEIIARVICDHPEYQRLLENEEYALEHDYPAESTLSNPFLHMGMHITIREQLAARRPAGVNELHQALLTRLGDAHAVEHHMLECLGETLWRAQRSGSAPDEAAYLECLRRAAQLI
ncbi:MAG: DUF1841 family protein [Gammaproteobacteria bacterium]|nr:DUF1841 family protein [Gammaproteobacteria bacterium]